MSYLYVKWNSFGRGCSPTAAPLKHVWGSLATLGTGAFDAVGGALRPKWREWPARTIRRVLSERVAHGISAGGALCITSELPSIREFGSFNHHRRVLQVLIRRTNRNFSCHGYVRGGRNCPAPNSYFLSRVSIHLLITACSDACLDFTSPMLKNSASLLPSA